MGRQGESEEATALVRALGVRHVTQAALGLLLDGTHVGRASRRAGAVVDVLHVGSLAALARLSGPGGRRLVAVDAPVELLLTALQAGSARTH